MFTGIVEEIGTIVHIKKGVKSSVLRIKASVVLENTKLGDSIAVNGVCLTVTDFSENEFEADVMSETLQRSSLGSLQKGSMVNLERAMAADGRFGGHIVSGHIDGIGTIKDIVKDDNAVWYTIETKPELLRYIVEKGSITIDGISLTIAYVDEKCFKVSIIPHTQSVTILAFKQLGSIVNLECDIIGKYVEKLIKPIEAKKQSNLTMDFLAEHGFA